MRLRNLFEDETKTAVASFGRLNPPTTGHNAMVSEIKKIPGDHFLFLTHTQGAKNPNAKPGTKAGENKDPLSFSEKLPLVKQAFPDINVGYDDVTKIFDMPVKLYKLGYKNLVIVAGSDRMPSYKTIFPKFNGVDGDHGYYKFDNIEFVELTRDEESEGVEGMSASKLRQAVRNDDFESFKTGLIAGNPQQLFDTIKERLAVDSLGVKQEEPKKDIEEAQLDELAWVVPAGIAALRFGFQSIKWIGRWVARNPKTGIGIGTLPWTGPYITALYNALSWLSGYGLPIAVGIIALYAGKKLYDHLKDKKIEDMTEEELIKLLKDHAPKSDNDLKGIIRKKQTNEIMTFGIRTSPKRATIKKRPEKFEKGTQEKIKVRRQAFAKGDKNAFSKDWEPKGGW